MRIKLLTPMAGYDEDGVLFSHPVGAELDLPADEARGYLEAGQAEPVAVKAAARRETRVKQSVETR